jgi:hypothetical protein
MLPWKRRGKLAGINEGRDLHVECARSARYAGGGWHEHAPGGGGLAWKRTVRLAARGCQEERRAFQLRDSTMTVLREMGWRV